MNNSPLVADKTGWSASGKLVTTDTSGLVALQCDFQRSGQKAGPYTVQFNVSPPSSGVFATIATITWSVEGNNVSRRVNVGNGVSISGIAQAVSVQVKDATPASFVGLFPYNVGILVAPGTRASVDRPPTLVGLRTATRIMAAGGTLAVPIPQAAGVISAEILVFPNDASLGAPQVTVFQADAAFENLVITNNSSNGFVPIAPSATVLNFVNNHASNDAYVNVFFGVDG